ncbi:unnamed protein product, partial [Symbiodinium microadriaticum]
AAKVWKNSQNQKTWAKKQASLGVLRQKEKEGEEASQKLRDKRAADQENAANSRVPEAEEPTRLLAPAAAASEPKHRLKGAEEVGNFINELFEVPEASAATVAGHTRGGYSFRRQTGDEAKAGEDKCVDIEEELFGHIPDEVEKEEIQHGNEQDFDHEEEDWNDDLFDEDGVPDLNQGQDAGV